MPRALMSGKRKISGVLYDSRIRPAGYDVHPFFFVGIVPIDVLIATNLKENLFMRTVHYIFNTSSGNQSSSQCKSFFRKTKPKPT